MFEGANIRRNKTIEKINKGFAVIAKAAKCDILPVSIVGVEKYNWIPFKAKIRVKIGTLISHELSQEEIIETWGKQVASMCHYNYVPTEHEADEQQGQKDFVNT